MSEGECRFAHETCLTHPLYVATLCTSAAAALRTERDKLEVLARGALEANRLIKVEREALRAALEAIARRVPIMGSTGFYRAGQEHALEDCRIVANAALAPGGREEKKA